MTHTCDFKASTAQPHPTCFCGKRDPDWTPALPTLQEAKAAADIAIETVTANANQDWKDAAYKTGVQLAVTRSTFISDDFHPILESMGLTVHDKRALGGVVRKLVSDKVIVAVPGSYRPSRRRHGTPQQVWTKA